MKSNTKIIDDIYGFLQTITIFCLAVSLITLIGFDKVLGQGMLMTVVLFYIPIGIYLTTKYKEEIDNE